MEIKYYEINEKAQKDAQSMWSFYEYVMGSTTKKYKQLVDVAYSYAEQSTEENKVYAETLAERYSRKLADYYNKSARIELMCPSVMIAGFSNFPVRKKEKQNEARNRLEEQWDYIKNIAKKIEKLKFDKRTTKQGVATKENFDNPFFKVVQNEGLNRLQLVFDDKPDEGTRTLLKANGYKWSPKNSVWQRQLTPNARASVRYLITKLTGRDKTE